MRLPESYVARFQPVIDRINGWYIVTIRRRGTCIVSPAGHLMSRHKSVAAAVKVARMSPAPGPVTATRHAIVEACLQ